MKVVILHPEKVAEESLAHKLAIFDVAALFAHSAKEALQIMTLHPTSVDLVVVHREGAAHQAAEEGLDFLEELRKDPQKSDLPVILSTSAWSDAQCAQHQATQDGVNAYWMVPPFDPDRLLSLMEGVLGVKLELREARDLSQTGTQPPMPPLTQLMKRVDLTAPGALVEEMATLIALGQPQPAPPPPPPGEVIVEEPAAALSGAQPRPKSLQVPLPESLQSPLSAPRQAPSLPAPTALVGGSGAISLGALQLSGVSMSRDTTQFRKELVEGSAHDAAKDLAQDAQGSIELSDSGGDGASTFSFEIETTAEPGHPEVSQVRKTLSEVSTSLPLSPRDDFAGGLEDGNLAELDLLLAPAPPGEAGDGFALASELGPPPISAGSSSGRQARILAQSKGCEDPDGELAQKMPYLFKNRQQSAAAILEALREFPAEAVAAARVPGAISQNLDVETLKKYLFLREQDVAVLSEQMRTAHDQVLMLETQVRELKALQGELQHVAAERAAALTQLTQEGAFEREKAEAERGELQFQLKASHDKARVLELKLKDAEQEQEQLKIRVRSDIRKIRTREKELENQLEIIKQDSQVLMSARENKMIDLKRKLDLLEFNMDLLQDQYNREKTQSAELKDQLSRVAQVVRVAGGLLSGPDEQGLGQARAKLKSSPAEH